MKKIEPGLYECHFGTEVIGKVRRNGRTWVAVLPNGTERDGFDTRYFAYMALRDTRIGGPRRMNAKGWIGVAESDWIRDWGSYWNLKTPVYAVPDTEPLRFDTLVCIRFQGDSERHDNPQDRNHLFRQTLHRCVRPELLESVRDQQPSVHPERNQR